MEDRDRIVVVTLSYEQAYEILNRCLASSREDTPVFRDALRRLAWAIEHDEAQQAA